MDDELKQIIGWRDLPENTALLGRGPDDYLTRAQAVKLRDALSVALGDEHLQSQCTECSNGNHSGHKQGNLGRCLGDGLPIPCACPVREEHLYRFRALNVSTRVSAEPQPKR